MKRNAVIITIAIMAAAGLYGCAEQAKAPETKQVQPITTQQMKTEDSAQLAAPVAGDKIAVIETGDPGKATPYYCQLAAARKAQCREDGQIARHGTA